MKKIFDFVVIIITAIAVALILAFGYYYFFIKGKTTGTYYIDEQRPIDLSNYTETLTAAEREYYENRMLFTVNYFSNDAQDGIPLQELRIDHFNDQTLTTPVATSSGMQYAGIYDKAPYICYTSLVNPCKSPDVAKQLTFLLGDDNQQSAQIKSYTSPEFFYYGRNPGGVYAGAKESKLSAQFNRGQQFVIKINEKSTDDNGAETITPTAYRLQLTGKRYEWKVNYLFFFTDFEYHYETWAALFNDVMQVVKNNSAGYGDFYLQVDLSHYFSIERFDGSEWKSDDLSDEIIIKGVVKVHYDRHGAQSAADSLFNSIEYNATYNISNVQYWKSAQVLTITEKDLTVRYSDVLDAAYLYLATSSREKFNAVSALDDVKIIIDVDLDSEQFSDVDVAGFDVAAFRDLKNVDTVIIRSARARSFELRTDAFKNTGIKTLKRSAGITLVNESESDFNEVIL